jgi:hypothetical protein
MFTKNEEHVCLSCSAFQANPLVDSWNVDYVENFVPHSADIEMKSNGDFSMLKEHRRIKKEMAAASYNKKLQKGGGASVIEDSRKSRSEFGVNQDSEVASEVMMNTSENESAGDSQTKASSEKSSASETEFRRDRPEGDKGLFNTEPNTLEAQLDKSDKMLTELTTQNSSLSIKKETSVVNTAELSKNPPSVLDNKESVKIHEDPSKIMTADSEVKNLENNAMSKLLKSSVIAAGIDIPQTDDESQKMLKIREVGGTAESHNFISEKSMSGLQEVENDDPLAGIYGSNLQSTKGTSIDNGQAVEDNITKHKTGMEWNNYNFNKNENPSTVSSNTFEAIFKQFRPFIDNQISESLQSFQEERAQTSLENFNSLVEPRYVSQVEPSSYYVQNAADAEYLKDAWNSRNQMCVVPCWRSNYVVQPYAYGLYVPRPVQNYVAGVQVPQVTLPSAYLPPMQFPDIQSGATAFSSVSLNGHGDQSKGHQNTQNQNYAVTSNAYGGSSLGSHSYAGASHAYVKEPLKHLQYSLTTPQKALHTSLIVKAPLLSGIHTLHPHQYVQPQMHHAEQQNINFQKSTYF